MLVNEELEKQNKTYDELNSAVDRSINIRRAEADSIDFVAQKEAMSNEERLALRQTFSEQMNAMFNSDFDMQRVLMSQQVEAFKAAEISQSEITKFEVEKRKQIRASEISFQAGAVSQLIGGLSQLNQASAGSAKVNARLAQAQALIDTYAGANKALASAPPPFNFVLAGSVIAAGLANVLTISRSMGDLKAFATGGDFVTSGPQMIMVGDNPGGRVRVQVTPLSSPNINGPQGINVNIQGNIIGTQEFVRDTLIPEINNTIQNNLA